MAQIIITLQPTATPGQVAPKLDLVEMPMPTPVDAWQGAVDILLVCVQLALGEVRKAQRGAAQRIVLAETMPALGNGGVR